jgi:hypothetical protein
MKRQILDDIQLDQSKKNDDYTLSKILNYVKCAIVVVGIILVIIVVVDYYITVIKNNSEELKSCVQFLLNIIMGFILGRLIK